MKMPSFLSLTVGVALSLPLTSALAQNEPKPKTPAPAATSAITNTADIAPTPKVTLERKKPLPADLKLSGWVTEIVKLAEAGMEDNVMQSFIDNAGVFSLGADQIIYLSDIGISSDVISAMLQHDQQIVAGNRIITTTYDPDYEAVAELLRSRTTNSTSASTIVTVVPAAQVSESGAKPDAPQVTALEPQPAVASTPKAGVPTGTVPLTFTPVPQTIVPKKASYPIRASQSEEISPPFLIIKTTPQTPNIIIVQPIQR